MSRLSTGICLFGCTALYVLVLLVLLCPYTRQPVQDASDVGHGYRFIYSGEYARTLVSPDGRRTVLDDGRGPDLPTSTSYIVTDSLILFRIAEYDDSERTITSRSIRSHVYFFGVVPESGVVRGPMDERELARWREDLKPLDSTPWLDASVSQAGPVVQGQTRPSPLLTYAALLAVEYPVLLALPLLVLPLYIAFTGSRCYLVRLRGNRRS